MLVLLLLPVEDVNAMDPPPRSVTASDPKKAVDAGIAVRRAAVATRGVDKVATVVRIRNMTIPVVFSERDEYKRQLDSIATGWSLSEVQVSIP